MTIDQRFSQIYMIMVFVYAGAFGFSWLDGSNGKDVTLFNGTEVQPVTPNTEVKGKTDAKDEGKKPEVKKVEEEWGHWAVRHIKNVPAYLNQAHNWMPTNYWLVFTYGWGKIGFMVVAWLIRRHNANFKT